MKAKDLSWQYKAGSGCLIWSLEGDQFLLIRRSEYVPVSNTWSLPGGRVDPGETPRDAARRETYEEIGFDIGRRPLKLIYKNETHAPRFRFFTYACIVDKMFEPTLNWESSDYLWCDISNLPENLHWGVEQMVNSDRAAKSLKGFITAYSNRR
jgi:ADP-ribose pyrophosphatase YjhB (NUDIX family)